MRLVKLLDRHGRFLDVFSYAQVSERCPCVGQCAIQDLLDFTDALSVQALLSLHRAKIHERITESCSCSGDIGQVYNATKCLLWHRSFSRSCDNDG